MNITDEMFAKCQEVAHRTAKDIALHFGEMFDSIAVDNVDAETMCMLPIVCMSYLIATKCFSLSKGYENLGNISSPEGVFNNINKIAVAFFNDMKGQQDDLQRSH